MLSGNLKILRTFCILGLGIKIIFLLRFLYHNMNICLGPDGHSGSDGEVVGCHHQVVVVVPEVLPLEPGLGLKVHYAEKEWEYGGESPVLTWTYPCSDEWWDQQLECLQSGQSWPPRSTWWGAWGCGDQCHKPGSHDWIFCSCLLGMLLGFLVEHLAGGTKLIITDWTFIFAYKGPNVGTFEPNTPFIAFQIWSPNTQCGGVTLLRALKCGLVALLRAQKA